MGRSVQPRSAATLAMAGFVWWIVTTLALQTLAPDAPDPVEGSISALALGRSGAFMDVAFFAFGIGSLSLSLGLYRFSRGSPAAPLLLACTGVLWFLLGLFQTGPDGTESAVHNIVATTSFLLILVVMFLSARRFRDDTRWCPFARTTLVWAIAAAGVFFSFPLLNDEAFGLWERAFVAIFVSWLLATAVRLRSVPAA